MYGYGFSLFLLAVGAVLRYAVDVSTDGFDWQVAGLILMIIGVIGVLFTLGFRLLEHDEYAGEERMDPLTKRKRWYRRY